MFRVGQKVVCVDDSFIDPAWQTHINQMPKDKNIYTVRGFASAKYHRASKQPAMVKIYLEEIVNPKLEWFSADGIFEEEIAFPVDRFRSVVEKKTSIAVFQEILDKVNGGLVEQVE